MKTVEEIKQFILQKQDELGKPKHNIMTDSYEIENKVGKYQMCVQLLNFIEDKPHE